MSSPVQRSKHLSVTTENFPSSHRKTYLHVPTGHGGTLSVSSQSASERTEIPPNTLGSHSVSPKTTSAVGTTGCRTCVGVYFTISSTPTAVKCFCAHINAYIAGITYLVDDITGPELKRLVKRKLDQEVRFLDWPEPTASMRDSLVLVCPKEFEWPLRREDGPSSSSPDGLQDGNVTAKRGRWISELWHTARESVRRYLFPDYVDPHAWVESPVAPRPHVGHAIVEAVCEWLGIDAAHVTVRRASGFVVQPHEGKVEYFGLEKVEAEMQGLLAGVEHDWEAVEQGGLRDWTLRI
ncbi:hypothetical protein LTR66_011478 [Elasticomyces elasticus]|nr:hypothetical protein LTR28_013928 [Elasticomyces elasticus]KAK4971192.1 hypothetical protein LTR66_011478 [Elasticomyces elasticus]